MTTYRSLVVTGPGEHGLQRIERAPLDDNQVRVRVAAVALCGTDFKLLSGRLHDANYPVVPGHEWSGYVLEAPNAPELVGELVVAAIYSPCGVCSWCRLGESQHCVHLEEIGFTQPGGCAEEVVVPLRNVRRVPEGITAGAACLLEPLTVAIHAVDRAPVLDGRTVVVLGGGAVGLLVVQLAIALGATAVVVEPNEHRRELGASLGATVASDAGDLEEGSADVVFDATGAAASFVQGVRLVMPTGTLLLVGYSGDDRCEFAPSSLMLKEVTVRGVLSGYGTLDRAIDAVVRGSVRLEPLVAPAILFDDYAALLEPATDRAPREPLLVSPENRALGEEA